MDRRRFIRALGVVACSIPLYALIPPPIVKAGATGVENEIHCTGQKNGWKTYECTGRQRYLFADGSAGEWQAGSNLFTALVTGGQPA